jgi:hypothetical protein
MLVANNVDCSREVCHYLCYIDIICFKNLNKLHYKTIVLPDFKQLFMSKLVTCEVVLSLNDASLFCAALYNTGAYVAGSFILDCLLGTNFHQDIDIYDQTGKDQEYDDNNHTIYTDPCYFNENGKNLSFTQYLYKNNFKSIDTSCAIRPVLRNFMNTSNVNYNDTLASDVAIGRKKVSDLRSTIQIIPVNLKMTHGKRSVIPRFIKASFDLEICQNIFDGNRVYIKNLNKLMLRYDYIKINTMLTVAVYGGSNNPPNYDYKKEVTLKRMDKYISRGFNIQLHPQHEEMYQTINKLFSNDVHPRKLIKYVDNGTIDLSKYDYI